MADVRKAKVHAEVVHAQLLSSIAELKHRLAPSTLAGDAWHRVRDFGGGVADKGTQGIRSQPAAAGSVVAALALFFLRGPISRLLHRLFGSDRDKGLIKADVTSKDDDFELTAPVVPQTKGN